MKPNTQTNYFAVQESKSSDIEKELQTMQKHFVERNKESNTQTNDSAVQETRNLERKLKVKSGESPARVELSSEDKAMEYLEKELSRGDYVIHKDTFKQALKICADGSSLNRTKEIILLLSVFDMKEAIDRIKTTYREDLSKLTEAKK